MPAASPVLCAHTEIPAASATAKPQDRGVVLVVGPDPEAMGGMAGVVAMMGTLDFGPHWHAVPFATTTSPGPSEHLFGRLQRHARHLIRLRRTLGDHRTAIVHVHTCSGVSLFRSAADMLLAQSLGCRVILHVHGAQFDDFFDNVGLVGRAAIRWILSCADCVVALSPRWRQSLGRMAPRARITVIENACPIAAQRTARDHQGPCRILLLAKMDEWKGIDDLLAACAELRACDHPFELVMAGPPGSAGDTDIISRKIRDHGVESSVRYVGPAFGDAKRGLLQWADVYVQPSHAEGMPIALLEAMAFHLPIVATAVGAIPEMIADRVSGLLVPPHHPDCLAEAISEMICSGELRSRMGAAAGKVAATRFGMARFREDLVRLYTKLLNCDSDSAVPAGFNAL